MKFFEDLRAEAKVALGGMEQDGRMGGEPMGGEPMMEAPMEEEDDLPFSTEELQSTDDVEMNKGGYMRGYAEAGLVTDPAAVAVENPDTQIQMDSMFGNMGSVNTGIEYLIYYGPNGEEITIQTFNGQPMSPIPPGYTIAPTAVAPITPVVTAPATGNAVAKAKAPVAAKAITKDKNDNDKPDPVKPETEAERMSRYQKRYGVDFTADEATQRAQIQDTINIQKAKLGLLTLKQIKDEKGNIVSRIVDGAGNVIDSIAPQGSILNKVVKTGTSNLLESLVGTVVKTVVGGPLSLIGGAVKETIDKAQASAIAINMLTEQVRLKVIDEVTFQKEVAAIRGKFNNKEEKELKIDPDASLTDWVAGITGMGTGKRWANDYLDAKKYFTSKFTVDSTGKPGLKTVDDPMVAARKQGEVSRAKQASEADAARKAAAEYARRQELAAQQVSAGSTPSQRRDRDNISTDTSSGFRGSDLSTKTNPSTGKTYGGNTTKSGKGGTGRGREDFAKGGLMTKKK